MSNLTNKPSTEKTYNLNDLRNWKFSGTSLAVIGYPVSHSLSPTMHNAALKEMKKEDLSLSNWSYYKFEIHPNRLSESLSLFYKKGFYGLNLTIPHKVIAYNLVDYSDSLVSKMGAVNTLQRTDCGKYLGFNTDGYGLSKAWKTHFKSYLSDFPVLLLGAGGAARAAAIQILSEGCPKLIIANRNNIALEALSNHLKNHFPRQDIVACLLSDLLVFEDPIHIIQATSLGLKAEDEPIIDFNNFHPKSKLLDMIYKPSETVNIKSAQNYGLETTNGLSMLLYQGAKALEIWTQKSVPIETMKLALQSKLYD